MATAASQKLSRARTDNLVNESRSELSNAQSPAFAVALWRTRAFYSGCDSRNRVNQYVALNQINRTDVRRFRATRGISRLRNSVAGDTRFGILKLNSLGHRSGTLLTRWLREMFYCRASYGAMREKSQAK